MKTYPSNFGGWVASTEEEPHKLLHTIRSRAQEDYTGVMGFASTEENILVFHGIQIRIKDKEPMSDDLGYRLALELIDGKRIRHEFFDLWEYLKAKNYVHGGPDEEDRRFFSDDGKRYEKLEQLDFWVDKYYSKPSTPRMNADEWLSPKNEDAPGWIKYKLIQRRRRKREEMGEKFKKPG